MNQRQWLEERKVAQVSPSNQKSTWDTGAWFQDYLEKEVRPLGFLYGGVAEIITVADKLLEFTPSTGTLLDEEVSTYRYGILSILIDWPRHTAASLANYQVFDCATGLHIAVACGILARINGCVTTDDLAGAKGNRGFTALHEAARCNQFDQIAGGVTAAQLAAVKDVHGQSALRVAAGYGHLKTIKEGITAAQLASDTDNDGVSALHAAAENLGLLLDVSGGVTADQLANAKDNRGWSALHCAAGVANQNWTDIVGGVSIEQLANSVYVPIGSALDIAVQSDNLAGVRMEDPEAPWLKKPETEKLLEDLLTRVPPAFTEKIANLLAVAQAARIHQSRFKAR